MQHLQKTGGGVPIMVNQVLETSHLPCSATLCLRGSVAAPPSILRTHFQVPYPATPLFPTLPKTAGVYTNNSHSGTFRPTPGVLNPSAVLLGLRGSIRGRFSRALGLGDRGERLNVE